MLESLSNKVALVKRDSNTYISSCEYCKILKNTFSTEHLQTTASLVKVHGIISFRIISKIGVNRKDKDLNRKELRHRYLPFCPENVRGF